MSIVYAIDTQLANYMAGRELDDVTAPLPTPPTDAALLLREASSLVTKVTRTAVYDVDATGLPTDAANAEAMAVAACITAAAWSLNDVNPLLGRSGAKQAISSKSGGGVAVQYASYADDAKARSDLASGEVLQAASLRVLDEAGLLSTDVQTWRS